MFNLKNYLNDSLFYNQRKGIREAKSLTFNLKDLKEYLA